MKWGIGASLLYMVAIIGVPLWFGAAPVNSHEWGEYLGGFMTPLALGWFVATLFLQRSELGLQRTELELQREEMKLSRSAQEAQSVQQERAANAYLEANRIAAATSFVESVPQYHKIFDDLLEDIGSRLPAEHMMPNNKGRLSTGRPLTAKKYGEYFSSLRDHGINIQDILINNVMEQRVSDYIDYYIEFKNKANSTNNTIYDMGPYFEAFNELFCFMGQRSEK